MATPLAIVDRRAFVVLRFLAERARHGSRSLLDCLGPDSLIERGRLPSTAES
jgi:hypothetical protein